MVRHRRVVRRMRGRGIGSFLSKVNSFLKKHKVISRVGSALGGVLPGKYGAIASTVGSAAGNWGMVGDVVGFGVAVEASDWQAIEQIHIKLISIVY